MDAFWKILLAGIQKRNVATITIDRTGPAMHNFEESISINKKNDDDTGLQKILLETKYFVIF